LHFLKKRKKTVVKIIDHTSLKPGTTELSRCMYKCNEEHMNNIYHTNIHLLLKQNIVLRKEIYFSYALIIKLYFNESYYN